MEKLGPHSGGGGRNLRIAGSLETQARRKRRQAARSNRRAKYCATPRPLRQLEVLEIANKRAMGLSRPLNESVDTIDCDFAGVLVLFIFDWHSELCCRELLFDQLFAFGHCPISSANEIRLSPLDVDRVAARSLETLFFYCLKDAVTSIARTKLSKIFIRGRPCWIRTSHSRVHAEEDVFALIFLDTLSHHVHSRLHALRNETLERNTAMVRIILG